MIVAVPDLETYTPQGGIGRVLHSLAGGWNAQVRLVGARLISPNLPLLRNFPRRVEAPPEAQAILLPKLTGASALAHTGGKPSLVIVHDIGVVDFPGDRAGMDYWSFQAVKASFYGLRNARHIVTVSEFSRTRLLHHLPDLAGRVSVAPNGVDESFLRYSRTREQALETLHQQVGPLGQPLLLYVGSELPRKNLGLLFRAFRELKTQYPQAVLLKVGKPGGDRWRQETLAVMQSLGLRSGADVRIAEGVDDSFLQDSYRAADVFVSPSLYEGFGLPALEAMSIGTPVVVVNRGASPEVVGGVGWVVEPETEALAYAIQEALEAPDREQRIAAGKLRAAQFGWARSSARVLEVLRGMVN